MKLLLINQYGRDSLAPTGRILAELGDALIAKGYSVQFLTANLTYGKPQRGISRILKEGLIHLSFIWRGLFGSFNAVISFTSPVCLPVTAALIARLRGVKHFHWAMDLHPDVGVELGELPKGLFTQFLSWLVGKAYRSATQVVSLDDDMKTYLLKVYHVDSVVVPPFPPAVDWPSPDTADNPPRKFRWLYSGNFGRAHEIQSLLLIQDALEKRGLSIELVLQGHGPQFLSAQDMARSMGLESVKWQDPVPLEALGESLLQADVLVVTRLLNMKGLLLPSKLMLAELSGKPILWIGDTDGHTARRLASMGKHGVFKPNAVSDVVNWLEAQARAPSFYPPQETSMAREQAVALWEEILVSKRCNSITHPVIDNL